MNSDMRISPQGERFLQDQGFGLSESGKSGLIQGLQIKKAKAQKVVDGFIHSSETNLLQKMLLRFFGALINAKEGPVGNFRNAKKELRSIKLLEVKLGLKASAATPSASSNTSFSENFVHSKLDERKKLVLQKRFLAKAPTTKQNKAYKDLTNKALEAAIDTLDSELAARLESDIAAIPEINGKERRIVYQKCITLVGKNNPELTSKLHEVGKQLHALPTEEYISKLEEQQYIIVQNIQKGNELIQTLHPSENTEATEEEVKALTEALNQVPEDQKVLLKEQIKEKQDDITKNTQENQKIEEWTTKELPRLQEELNGVRKQILELELEQNASTTVEIQKLGQGILIESTLNETTVFPQISVAGTIQREENVSSVEQKPKETSSQEVLKNVVDSQIKRLEEQLPILKSACEKMKGVRTNAGFDVLLTHVRERQVYTNNGGMLGDMAVTNLEDTIKTLKGLIQKIEKNETLGKSEMNRLLAELNDEKKDLEKDAKELGSAPQAEQLLKQIRLIDEHLKQLNQK